MKKFRQVAIMMAVLIATSCGTESPDDMFSDKVAGESLVGKSWWVSGIEIQLGTVIPKNCVSDNNFTYFGSGRYEVNEGVTKCTAEDPPGLVGSWSIDEGGHELTIQIGDSLRIWRVIETQTTLHRLASDFGGEEHIYTFQSN